MAVVLFDHAGVGMSEVFGHHHQRHAIHRRQARPGVAQRMEARRRDPASMVGSALLSHTTRSRLRLGMAARKAPTSEPALRLPAISCAVDPLENGMDTGWTPLEL
jgi:hypothetical protein